MLGAQINQLMRVNEVGANCPDRAGDVVGRRTDRRQGDYRVNSFNQRFELAVGGVGVNIFSVEPQPAIINVMGDFVERNVPTLDFIVAGT